MHNPLLNNIAQILSQEQGAVWSEHSLIRRLVTDGLLAADYAGDSLALFQTHFLIMNALYQLRRQFAANGQGQLHISPLAITLAPAADAQVATAHALAASDTALETYYLDWQQFHSTTAESVTELLRSFWRRYVAQDDRTRALHLLELQEPVTFAQIRQRYRQKAMLWHPDRGGSETQFAELNAAMDVLERCYGRNC